MEFLTVEEKVDMLVDSTDFHLAVNLEVVMAEKMVVGMEKKLE